MRDIIVDLTNLDITLYDTAIIREGEHNASQLVITLSEDLVGHSNNLVFALNRNEPQVKSNVTVVAGVITYPIPNTLIYEHGTLKVEIQSFDALNFLIKSVIVKFKVSPSIGGVPVEVPPNLWDKYPHGFMDKDTYDPNLILADVFDMDSMAEGVTTKIFTGVERTKLGLITGDVEPTPNTYIIRDSDGDARVNGINYDLTPTPVRIEGGTKWNPSKHTIDVGITGASDVALQIGQDVTIWAYNNSGYEMPVGTVVALSGSVLNVPSIIRADANDTDIAKNVIGIVAGYTIPIDGQGYVSLNGLISNITTIDYAEGDILYLSDEAGRITNVKPSLPSVPVIVGWCIIQASSGTGQIYVGIDRQPLASEIPVFDVAENYVGENVEDTLTEIANRIKPAYSELYVYNGNVPQNIPNGTTYTKLTPFMIIGENINGTSDATNQQIIVGLTGKYRVGLTASSVLDTNGNTLETVIFKNGLEVQKAHIIRYIATASQNSTGSMTLLLDCNAGDVLDIRIRHDRISTVAITNKYCNFNITRVLG